MPSPQRQRALRRINYLTNETDAIYHRSSLRFGITDSVSVVLYTLYDHGGSCLLSEVYKSSGVSKQTINSALRSMERDELIYLEAATGRTKRITLTAKGHELTERTAARLVEAEVRAFDGWSEEKIASYIAMMEEYTEALRRQIELL